MDSIFHVLNGDTLKEQFPDDLPGTIYIARECLVDGDISGATLKEFYTNRAAFLSSTYEGTQEEYHKKVVTQFKGIQAIPEGAEVHLWFEDDLFCQINLWFVLHLLDQANFQAESLYIVRPEKHTMYGFGGLNQQELVQAYQQKTHIDSTSFETLAQFW